MVKKIKPAIERNSITFIDNMVYSKVYAPLIDAELELKMSIMGQFGASEMKAAMGTVMGDARRGENLPKKPVILWIPGGGFRGVPGSDKNLMVSEMQFLAEAGYIVASIYYRSSGEAHFPAQLIDVKSAIRYLRANADKYNLDPDKIAVAGRSAGGHLTALACMNLPGYDEGENLEYSSDVNLGIDYFGPSDLFKAFAQTRELLAKPNPRWKTVEESHVGALIGGSELSKPELTRQASPVFHVNDKTAPMLILHGDADSMVECTHSVDMYEAMVAAGKPCELYILEGAGHGSEEFWQDCVKEIVLEYLGRYLKLN